MSQESDSRQMQESRQEETAFRPKMEGIEELYKQCLHISHNLGRFYKSEIVRRENEEQKHSHRQC